MEGIKLIPAIILLIAISGIIAGAASIVIGKFGDSMTACYNDSFSLNVSKKMCNAPIGAVDGDIPGNSTTFLPQGKDGLNLSNEYYTKVVSQEGIGTVAEQIPTVAIIAVMVIIISVIAGVFAYMRLFG